MKTHSLISSKRPVSCGLILRLGLLTALALSGAGCAAFNSNMTSVPSHSGPPPYAGDPEANGNPEKAWYN